MAVDPNAHFNPRSREGSDCFSTSSICFLDNFNPRSREGSDFLGLNFLMFMLDFNPRSREGSDVTAVADVLVISYFNPRSREGSDRTDATAAPALTGFQSTLSRRERRTCRPGNILAAISIHALAKGATVRRTCGAPGGAISIHALAKGATLSSRSHERPRCYFNPRSREGSDGAQRPKRNACLYISIHALAKGATAGR